MFKPPLKISALFFSGQVKTAPVTSCITCPTHSVQFCIFLLLALQPQAFKVGRGILGQPLCKEGILWWQTCSLGTFAWIFPWQGVHCFGTQLIPLGGSAKFCLIWFLQIFPHLLLVLLSMAVTQYDSSPSSTSRRCPLFYLLQANKPQFPHLFHRQYMESQTSVFQGAHFWKLHFIMICIGPRET